MDVGTRMFVPVTEHVVVATTPQETWVHIYSTVDEMAEELKVISPEDATAQGLEFFDGAGRRLVPVMDAQNTLTLKHTMDPPNPAVVLGHFRKAIRQAEDLIRSNPAVLLRLRMSLEEALARLPQLDGVDLRTAMLRCGPAFGHRLPSGGGGNPADPNNPGSVWHVIVVHGLG
jgi:hypothetical protein